MNIERMNRLAKEVEIVQQMITLAGIEPEIALVALEAISEKQRDYGMDTRISALANVWSGVLTDYKTPEFAATIVRAANRHQSAKWWIECEPKFSLAHKGSFVELDNDIEEEMSK